MTTEDQTFSDYFQLLKHRARAAGLSALAVLLGAIVIVFSLPAVYESYATLLIQQSDITPEMLGGTSPKEFVEERLQQTRQLVMTADNARELITRYRLFEDSDEKLSEEDQITRFNESVSIRPQVTGVVDPRSMRGGELTYAFDVAFRYGDPEVARDVAAALAEEFTTAGSTRTRAEAERMSTFLRAEADRLQEELREREARLAEFRQRYPGGSPEDRAGNLNRARDLERDLARADDELRDARARKDLLETQLRDTPRDRPVLDETGQQVIRGEDRLAAAQQELVAALAKYSEDHPDVRRLRREIAQLTSEVSGGSQSTPTNPTYLAIQAQVASAETAIRALTARRYDISSSLSQVRSAVSQSPVYEKQYADLVRDYELVKTQYEEMRKRQAGAEITQKAAGAEAAEAYVLINPAVVPSQPIEPDRVALMFLGIVLSLAAGIGIAVLLNATDTTVRGSLDITMLAGTGPLGQVPLMRSAEEARRRLLGNIGIVAVMFATTAVILYVTH